MTSQFADNKFGYLTSDVTPTASTLYVDFNPWVSSGRLLTATSDTTFEYIAFSAVSGTSSPYTITVAANGRNMDTVAVPSTGSATGLAWNAGTRVELVAMHDQLIPVEGNPLQTSAGGTGTNTTFTQGSVVFAGASGVYTQDNANIFYDDINNRLGLWVQVPSTSLHVKDEVTIGVGGTTWSTLSLKNATNTNTVKVVAGVTASNYTLTLPTALVGTWNAIIDNGSGVLGFGIPSFPTKVYVYLSWNQSISSGSAVKIAYDTIQFDALSEFSTLNNRFTAKSSGYYRFNVKLAFGLSWANPRTVALCKNGSWNVIFQETHNYSVSADTQALDWVIYLNANDYVEVYFYVTTVGLILLASWGIGTLTGVWTYIFITRIG